MSFVSKNIYKWGVVAIWKIEENEVQLSSMVTQSDLDSIVGINSKSKRVERLSWRALLRDVMPDLGEVEYDKHGAPRINGVNISVSHNREYAVIALSNVNVCAVDVESKDRNFERVASRYISKEDEIVIGLSELCDGEKQKVMCAVWCAKEVLYKCSESENLDLLTNLKICSYKNNTIFGEIISHDEVVEVKMDILEIGESILVVGISSSVNK